MPRLRHSRAISRTGLTVPSTLETWVTQASFTSGVSSSTYFSTISSPRSSIGAAFTVAPRRAATSCHGTMLAWCSITVVRMLSPAFSAGSTWL